MGCASVGAEASPERIYVDNGLTGTDRDCPGLRQALAACRAGDTLVVTKLDRARALAATRARSPTSSPPGRRFVSNGAISHVWR
jgi:DNA invertase Pin-like site-specific DNA recombinase